MAQTGDTSGQVVSGGRSGLQNGSYVSLLTQCGLTQKKNESVNGVKYEMKG